MLNAGVLSFGTDGRVKTLLVSSYPEPFFNGGTPASLLGELVIAPYQSGYEGLFKLGGLPYTVEGALLTDTIGVISGHVGAVPITVNGAVALSAAPGIAYWEQGIPFSADGRIATVPSTIVNLHAFDSSFAQSEFN